MPTVFEGEHFSVRSEERVVRDQAQRFEVVIRREVALCVPVLQNGGIVLTRQYRAGAGSLVLEFPAGRLEPNETPESAAERELLEEAGFSVQKLQRIGTVLTAPHFSNELVHVLLAWGSITEKPHPTPHEEIGEVLTVTRQDLNSLIASGSLRDAKSMAAYSLVLAREISLTANP
jgi:ADP-ribose pyrophosphatase